MVPLTASSEQVEVDWTSVFEAMHVAPTQPGRIGVALQTAEGIVVGVDAVMVVV